MSAAITRLDLLPGELRREASRLREAQAARRALAVVLVLEGADRTHAANACGRDRQTLRDWVHRDNVEGTGGLFNRKPAGRKARLGAEQKARIAELGEAGNDSRRFKSRDDDRPESRARATSATSTGSVGASAATKPRRTKGSILDADRGSNLNAD